MEGIEDFSNKLPGSNVGENMNSIDLSKELSKCQDSFVNEISCDNNNLNKSDNSSTVQINDSLIENEPKASTSFQIDQTAIPCIPKDQLVPELQDLGVHAYDQSQFETEVVEQVEKAIQKDEEIRRKREAEKELKSVTEDIRLVKRRLGQLDKALSLAPKDEKLMTNAAKREVITLKEEQESKLKDLTKLEAKQKTLSIYTTGNIDELSNEAANCEDDTEIDEEMQRHLQQVFAPKESEEERLIRTGEMTPFGTVNSQRPKLKPKRIMIPQNHLTDFDKFLLDQAKEKEQQKLAKIKKSPSKANPPRRYIISAPMNKPSTSREPDPVKELVQQKRFKPTTKKMKLGSQYAEGISKFSKEVAFPESDSDYSEPDFKYNGNNDSDTSDKEYKPEEWLSDDSDDDNYAKKSRGSIPSKKKKGRENNRMKASPAKRYRRVKDDGCQKSYIKRIKTFEKAKLLEKHRKIMESEDGIVNSDEEYFEFDDFKVPSSVWNKLYRYQQTGVRWLWELHQQNCGGIVGDEMGLGKTIQIIAFLIGLEVTNDRTSGDIFRGKGPIILVCPTTVMHQWVKEFHSWWPLFRVAVLHESGSFAGNKTVLITNVNRARGILVTSYTGLVQHQVSLLQCEWHYVILDEGHKIRNPDAQATLVAKQFRTVHRLILSGSPIQNNLKELWSLFDFIFPGKLGTLPVFMEQFSVPIVQGGYANASQVQVQTAYKCATVLRDTIKPYLLRRMKDDVKTNIQLPSKNEQVLFCQLTEEQRRLYKAYVDSSEVQSILNARLKVFVGLINLRKICNHPDIYTGGPKVFKDTDVSILTEEERYGYYKRSGKMIVVESLLRLWHKQGHRVLLFSQSRQMLEILEIFVKKENYTYMKMDGSTPISSRQPAINTFNSDPSIFVFLLTTRVGGLGVNLTGADRVVIYDPDWNPSTDAQARERSWRIGQDKQVTIYRLLTAGTIEEKIYHRQIFKQFVTNRVLKDPRQRRFFKSNDLYELFTYSELGKQGTETSAIFAGTGSEVKPLKNLKKCDSRKDDTPKIEISFSSSKIEKMKEIAKKLSTQLAQNKLNTVNGQTKSNDHNSSAKISSTLSRIQNLKTVNSEKSDSLEGNSLKASVQESKSTPMEVESSTVKEPKSSAKELHPSIAENSSVAKELKSSTKKKLNKKHVRKRKWKSAMVEGEEIQYLIKTDTYKPPQEENEKKATNDDYVLSRLFKKSGVHTAIKHDVIVDSSAPDYMLVEGEANKVAQDAIKALRQSRRQCASAREGIPTWTGSNNLSKHKFGSKRRLPPSVALSSSTTSANESKSGPSGILCKRTFGNNKSGQDSNGAILSSADLFAAIERRNGMFCSAEQSNSNDNEELNARVLPQTEYDELLAEIRNFIAFGAATDGQATTQEIVQKFKNKLPVEHTAVFRALLNKICDFSRISSGDGIWYLKGEFR